MPEYSRFYLQSPSTSSVQEFILLQLQIIGPTCSRKPAKALFKAVHMPIGRLALLYTPIAFLHHLNQQRKPYRQHYHNSFSNKDELPSDRRYPKR